MFVVYGVYSSILVDRVLNPKLGEVAYVSMEVWRGVSSSSEVRAATAREISYEHAAARHHDGGDRSYGGYIVFPLPLYPKYEFKPFVTPTTAYRTGRAMNDINS